MGAEFCLVALGYSCLTRRNRTQLGAGAKGDAWEGAGGIPGGPELPAPDAGRGTVWLARYWDRAEFKT